ncbi:MAG: hypothetical protein ACR2PG_27650 [Hyphomicrobiaceae bacterium]
MQNKSERILATVKGNVSLSSFDVASGVQLGSVAVGKLDISKPHELTLTQDNSRAFVSLYGDKDYGPNKPDNRLAVVDVQNMKLVGHVDLGLYLGPHALMTDVDGMIWVTVDASRCVLIINPDTWVIEQTIHLGAPAHFLASTSDGLTVYFSAKEVPIVLEVDVRKREVRAQIPLPVGGQAIRVSRDDKRLYVGHLCRPFLHVIDCDARQISETVPLRGVPGWPFVSRNDDCVIVTTYDEPAQKGFVELLDSNDLDQHVVIEVEAEPFHALPMHDSEHALVALANGEIIKIHLKRAKIVAGRFYVGGTMPEMLLHLPAPE